MPKFNTPVVSENDVLIGYLVVDVSHIVNALSDAAQRAEWVRSIASGEPASFVYERLRHRRQVSP